MRKILPALLAIACGSATAQSNVQIYGRLNVGLESLQNDGTRVSRLSNNRSVLGFNGSEDLGGGTRIIFQIEGTLAPDTGAGSPAARDTRLGIQGSAGTLFAGNWVTPYNGATAGLDPYYPTTAGYMSIMGNGAGATVSNTSDTSSFDRRQQNSVHYWTPVWNGLQLRVAQGMSEERPANSAKPSLTSAALVYEQGPWYATAAYERHHAYQGPGLNDSAAKLGAGYRFGDTRVALVAEKLRYETAAGTLERNDTYASVTHQVGRGVFKLGVGHAGDGSGSAPTGTTIGYARKGDDTGATHITAGYDYNLSKRSTVYAYYSHLNNDRNGVVDFAINSLGAQPGATLKGLVLGLRHNF
ncbi:MULTISPECIES: porin [unclassified Duganella]|jgi:predicted porin|uniref:porin n=1 Tax=unclassified Duganella TaxID=2636909 RepID=UPI000883D867|nr:MULTISPECIES: porin [unclassified Duganella]SDH17210.1 Outer membrane protein (porin) [Duganella sp. OV458]SDK31787.1 Outer membrane protein (porin) [Duganella sp. OV510]